MYQILSSHTPGHIPSSPDPSPFQTGLMPGISPVHNNRSRSRYFPLSGIHRKSAVNQNADGIPQYCWYFLSDYIRSAPCSRSHRLPGPRCLPSRTCDKDSFSADGRNNNTFFYQSCGCPAASRRTGSSQWPPRSRFPPQ